ncbi:hypothetical protein PSPO01_02605 [Paraphaeosphaeria sporulosa]
MLTRKPEGFDYDCITEVSFESEEPIHEFNTMYTHPEVIAEFAEDEERFTVKENMKAIVIGEVRESSPRNDY